EGSKLVIAAAGPRRRELTAALPEEIRLPDGFTAPRVCLPGVLALQGPAFKLAGEKAVEEFCRTAADSDLLGRFPLLVIVDDSEFTARSLNNFLWVTFTRSNPAADIHGIRAFTQQKHWGCEGPLVIDARLKPHHAPPLEVDPQVSKRVDALAARGGPLQGIL